MIIKHLKKMICVTVDSIFNQDQDGAFQNMIDTVYKETSAHLLEVMHTKYKFMDHLKVSLSCFLTFSLIQSCQTSEYFMISGFCLKPWGDKLFYLTNVYTYFIVVLFIFLLIQITFQDSFRFGAGKFCCCMFF